MTILIGQLATSDGTAMQSSVELTANGRGAVEYRDLYTAPAVEYRSEQPATIPVDIEHSNRVVGEVLFLAQRGLGLFAVIDVDENELPDPPWYLSAELAGERRDASFRDITLHRVAIVEQSATVGKTPAVAVVGTVDDAHLYRDNGHHRPLLAEAAEYLKSRRYCGRQPHVVARDRYAPRPEAPQSRAAGPLEVRSAPTLDVVEYRRTITVLAAPLGEEATVIVHGRVVGERFGPGCFAGDERRAQRVKALRDHDPTRVVGKAVSIDPYSKLGCIAELRISQTPLGDETLALAEDRVLDASVGFRIKPSGEAWDATRTRRTVTAGELDHIALVASPAYNTANVIDVRNYR